MQKEKRRSLGWVGHQKWKIYTYWEKRKKGGSVILLSNASPRSTLKQACKNPNQGHKLCTAYMTYVTFKNYARCLGGSDG